MQATNSIDSILRKQYISGAYIYDLIHLAERGASQGVCAKIFLSMLQMGEMKNALLFSEVSHFEHDTDAVERVLPDIRGKSEIRKYRYCCEMLGREMRRDEVDVMARSYMDTMPQHPSWKTLVEFILFQPSPEVAALLFGQFMDRRDHQQMRLFEGLYEYNCRENDASYLCDVLSCMEISPVSAEYLLYVVGFCQFSLYGDQVLIALSQTDHGLDADLQHIQGKILPLCSPKARAIAGSHEIAAGRIKDPHAFEKKLGILPTNDQAGEMFALAMEHHPWTILVYGESVNENKFSRILTDRERRRAMHQCIKNDKKREAQKFANGCHKLLDELLTVYIAQGDYDASCKLALSCFDRQLDESEMEQIVANIKAA